ncbi:protein bax [Enterobacteriaceae bacterium ESL0689]|nr:protein bax [Enterobacteriaceae bacterium ESL0689]
MITGLGRRYGAALLMLVIGVFSANTLAASQTTTKSQNAAITKKNNVRKNKTKKNNVKVSEQQAHSGKNITRHSLPDLRKYPSGTPRKKAFLRTVMPHITRQSQVITADRNWLITKQSDKHWSSADRARLSKIASRYKVRWSGNTRHIPWNTLMERVDIIPDSMVATTAAAESGWGTSKLARINNNLFGMKCGSSQCGGEIKGYSQFASVEHSVQAYVTNLNTHPAYHSFRQSRAQLRKMDQEVTTSTMIHKLESYSTRGSSYNSYLFTMYQHNQQLIAAHL